MSRYLNPSKIGVLCLAHIYSDNIVPTKAIIPILSFIADLLLPPDTSKPEVWNKSLPLIPRLEDFKQLTRPLSSARPGRTLWDIFVERLWFLNSFDALNAFFSDIDHVLAPGPEALKDAAEEASDQSNGTIKFSHDSPVGLFVRKAQIEFLRLQFHDATALWKAFIQFRRPSFEDWRKRHPAAGDLAFDSNLDQGSGSWSYPLMKLLYSSSDTYAEEQPQTILPSDAEQLLRFQVDVMQKTGGLIPEQMVQQFHSMLHMRADKQPLVEYVKFLKAWRSGDQVTAFDSLHRYFDYTMYSTGQSFYQYALVSLAVMQADFGDLEQAAVAMQEAIKTARDNQDPPCLNFALNWMYQFTKAKPGQKPLEDKTGLLQSEREGLEYLRKKAKATGQWSLFSSTLLSEAKLGLLDGDSMAITFEKLAHSWSTNVTKQLYPLMGQQTLLQSSAYGRMGLAQLANAQMEVYHLVLAPFTTFEEQVKALCRSAYLKCDRGQYEEGLALLRSIPQEKKDVLRISQYVSIFEGMLRARRFLLMDDTMSAEDLLPTLQDQTSLDPDIKFELDMLQIELLLKHDSIQSAFDKVAELDLEQQKHYSVAGTTDLDITHRVRLMVKKAQLWAAVGTPERGFSVALRACSLAYRTKCMGVLWDAVRVLCSVMNSLSDYEAAFELLEVIIPRALEADDAALAAKCWSTRVDSQIGIADGKENGSQEQHRWITKASEGCDRALTAYDQIGDVRGQADIMMKKAMLLHALGEVDSAKDWSIRSEAKKEESRRMMDLSVA